MTDTTTGHCAQSKPLVTRASFDGLTFAGISPNECLTPDWLPVSNWGYHTAYAGAKGKSVLAHRLSYRIFVGVIPNGMLVLHRCGNRACVNPHHLYLGDAQQNQDDRFFHGQFDPGCCPQQRLSPLDVLNIRASKKRNADLAREYNVGRSTISNIRLGRTRTNVKEG